MKNESLLYLFGFLSVNFISGLWLLGTLGMEFIALNIIIAVSGVLILIVALLLLGRN